MPVILRKCPHLDTLVFQVRINTCHLSKDRTKERSLILLKSFFYFLSIYCASCRVSQSIGKTNAGMHVTAFLRRTKVVCS